jgi:replication initiator protein RepSA
MELAAELLAGLVARASRRDFDRFESQLETSGFCAHPVRLIGHVESCDASGRRRWWSTESEPDGVLRKACGNRREAVCPPRAERYRYDAYQLIAAGLRGGKGVPDSVARHPAVFGTLTAPGFGAVHTRRTGPAGQPRRCRPRRDAPECEHGNAMSCNEVHDEDDPGLGEPICSDCFDHRRAVVWNNALSELWRRTTIYLPRAGPSVGGHAGAASPPGARRLREDR